MKKVIITIMAILLMMNLASCGKEEPKEYTITVGETYEQLVENKEDSSKDTDDGISKYSDNTVNWYIRAYEDGIISYETLEDYLFG